MRIDRRYCLKPRAGEDCVEGRAEDGALVLERGKPQRHGLQGFRLRPIAYSGGAVKPHLRPQVTERA
jgi:hypothetical protein